MLALLLLVGHLVDAPVAMAQGTRSGDSSDMSALLAVGQRIYREGVLGSGEPLGGLGAAQTRIIGKDAACATCHRRSGFGASEGRFTIRPIVSQALLQEQTVPIYNPRIKARLGSSQRPPYNEALLARAVLTGVDTAGKPLDAVMPRFALGDADMKALSAYLFSLGAAPSPGVDDHDIHFATVIQPGVSPERRRAMLDVMQAFVKDKGANMRQEELRREAGVMRMYRAYRKWVLHVWELKGPSDTWNAQLEAFYREQPVFALIGGLGSASWQPIHEFAERREVPSVFPQVEMPVVTGANQYNLYLSRGVVLEADVLARFLREQGATGQLTQVFRRDQAGAVAAAQLRSALKADDASITVEDRVLDGPPTEDFWRKLGGSRPGALVLWLNARDVETMPSSGSGASAVVYLSSELLAGRVPEAVSRAGVDVRMIYPSDLPPRSEARLLRNRVWLRNKGMAVTDEAVQINTQFTMAVVSDVVGHMADSFSRDYFVERLEHVAGQTPLASMYQSVSLGPGQRFVAKGGSVVQVIGTDKHQWKALSGWIVP
jgi:Cytochrome c